MSVDLFLNYLIGIPRHIPPVIIKLARLELPNLDKFTNKHLHSNSFFLVSIGNDLQVTCRECGEGVDYDTVIQLARSELTSLIEFTNKHAHSDIFILEQIHGAIGNGSDVTCKECGTKKDITDLDIW